MSRGGIVRVRQNGHAKHGAEGASEFGAPGPYGPRPEQLPLASCLARPPPDPPVTGPTWGGVEVDLSFTLQDDLQIASSALLHSTRGESLWNQTLAVWLETLAPGMPRSLQSPAYSLGLAITDDAAIAALNREWRQRDGATDVLAFAAQENGPPLPEPEGDGRDLGPLELGDIVISLEMAARQADEAGHCLDQELLFLASHGLLHLLGWDHPDEPSLEAMLNRQNDLLSQTVHLFRGMDEHCEGESPR